MNLKCPKIVIQQTGLWVVFEHQGQYRNAMEPIYFCKYKFEGWSIGFSRYESIFLVLLYMLLKSMI
ncbi:hypothetical protein MtrunA17_Chr4g0059591 [Medicago truncatula]|uniref:Uncharacterized protein n=1 Tax=Medicago truncatula TaxID=3880 RepID=A0A396IFH8_MEDTR|nr:hypothetical protein MtrunA17_Chr4g0059591 [Medicago truncatula]